jgi:hypothetical protein
MVTSMVEANERKILPSLGVVMFGDGMWIIMHTTKNK